MRQFVFKMDKRIFSITSYKDCCCSLFRSWVIKQQKCCIFSKIKKRPTLVVWCAPKMVPENWNLIFSEASTLWIRRICKNSEKRHFCVFLRRCLKKSFSIFQVLGTVNFVVWESEKNLLMQYLCNTWTVPYVVWQCISWVITRVCMQSDYKILFYCNSYVLFKYCSRLWLFLWFVPV